jgi:hypothetical protein
VLGTVIALHAPHQLICVDTPALVLHPATTPARTLQSYRPEWLRAALEDKSHAVPENKSRSCPLPCAGPGTTHQSLWSALCASVSSQVKQWQCYWTSRYGSKDKNQDIYKKWLPLIFESKNYCYLASSSSKGRALGNKAEQFSSSILESFVELFPVVVFVPASSSTHSTNTA